MLLRISLFAILVAALAGFFGVQRLLDGDSTASERAATASRRSTTAAQLQLLEQEARDRPEDVAVLTRLGSAYVQRARETGDPSFYRLADAAASQASSLAPDDSQVLIVSGTVALAKHDFEGALALGERARSLNPDVVAAYGVITDALVELGRYEEATATAQEMIDRRPDFASYSRASYLRELHGDLDGAIEAMAQAAAGAPSDFDEAWAFVIIGNLHLQRSDVDAAAAAYGRAEQSLPGDAIVNAGLARLAMAQGDLGTAEVLLRDAVQQRPLPEYAIALGELLEALGRTAVAEEQYALVRATQQLFAASGVDTDIELASFDADHGTDPQATYRSALAAYGLRPSVFSADTVAWAAYKAGKLTEARRYSLESLRLGTKDPRLLFHAGVIANAEGEAQSAETYLRAAVEMKPAQSVLYASAARNALDALTSSASR